MRVAAGRWIAVGVFCGAYFGAKMAGTLSAIAMRRLHAVCLLVVAIYFLLAPQVTSKSRLPAAAGPEQANDNPA
jgi:uncharacterized membrane protein YfcA